MNSKLSKFSPRTNAIIAGATMLALMVTQNVSAATIDPETYYAGDALGRATFFMFFIGYISMGIIIAMWTRFVLFVFLVFLVFLALFVLSPRALRVARALRALRGARALRATLVLLVLFVLL